jgi:hypothetical protein
MMMYFASRAIRLQTGVPLRQPDQVVKRDSVLQVDYRPSLVRAAILLRGGPIFIRRGGLLGH